MKISKKHIVKHYKIQISRLVKSGMSRFDAIAKLQKDIQAVEDNGGKTKLEKTPNPKAAVPALDEKEVKRVADAMMNTICNLKGRWMDEKEYEDFADYESAMFKKFADTKVAGASDWKWKKASKSPFGVTAVLNGWEVLFKATATQYQWKAQYKG